MNHSAPKVFVSCAGEQKESHGRPLTDQLLQNGIDAFFYPYEISPGDDIPGKVFEDGIKPAQTIILLLSQAFIAKAWTKAELSTAIAKRIGENIRLIPVICEDCVVPEALKSTCHIDLTHGMSLEQAGCEIIAILFGHSAKPGLGAPPGYVADSASIPGLRPIDSQALECLYDALHSASEGHCDVDVALAMAQSKGVLEHQFYDSVEILIADDYLERGHTSSGFRHPCDVRVLPRTILIVARDAKGEDVQELALRLAGLIINDGVDNLGDMIDRTAASQLLALSILRVFKEQGYLNLLGRQMPGPRAWSVHSPSATFRRWFESRSSLLQ